MCNFWVDLEKANEASTAVAVSSIMSINCPFDQPIVRGGARPRLKFWDGGGACVLSSASILSSLIFSASAAASRASSAPTTRDLPAPGGWASTPLRGSLTSYGEPNVRAVKGSEAHRR